MEFPSFLDYNAAAGRGELLGNQREPDFPIDFPFGNGPMGIAASVGTQFAMQQFLGVEDFTQFGFSTRKNAMRQAQAKQYWRERQLILQQTQAFDQQTQLNMLRGLAAATGTPFGNEQEAAAKAIVDSVGAISPVLAQMMPETFDAMHGSRGSAMVMGIGLHRGSRFAVDPFTGRTGMSADSAAVLNKEIARQFFGPTADLGAMRGLSAGQTGLMYEELALRGMLGRGIGTYDSDVQRQLLTQDRASLTNTLRALSESTDAGDKRRFESLLDAANREGGGAIRGLSKDRQIEEMAKLDSVAQQTLKELSNVSGGGMQTILATFDATRVGENLKNMAKAVTAVRDIFGDAGKPDAPMAELISALQKMTQGGMSSMTAAQMEQSVRMTYQLGKYSGVGLDAMMGLTGQLGGLADTYGLDRQSAISAAQGAAAYGSAYSSMSPRAQFGMMDASASMLLDANLRMNASRSEAANRMGAAFRMQEWGLVNENSMMSSYLSAIRGNKSTFEFGGSTYNVNMGQGAFLDMAGKSGVDMAQARNMLLSRHMNQESAMANNVQSYIREVGQVEEISGTMLRGAYEQAMTPYNDRIAKAAGLNAAQMQGLRSAMQRSASQRFFAGEAGDDDPSNLRSAITTASSAAARAYLKSQGKTDDEINQIMANTMTDDTMRTITNTWWDQADERAFKSHYRGLANVRNQFARPFIERTQAARRAAESFVKKESALAGLGTSGVLERVSDELQRGDVTTTREALLRIAGNVSDDAIAARLAPIEAELRRLEKAADPATVGIRDALREGGDMATAALENYAKEKGTTVEAILRRGDATANALQAAATGGGTAVHTARTNLARQIDATNILSKQYDAIGTVDDKGKRTVSVEDAKAQDAIARTIRAVSTGGELAIKERDRLLAEHVAAGRITEIEAATIKATGIADSAKLTKEQRTVLEGVTASAIGSSATENAERLGMRRTTVQPHDINEVTTLGRRIANGKGEVSSDTYRNYLQQQDAIIDALSNDGAAFQALGRRKGDRKGATADVLMSELQELQSERQRLARQKKSLADYGSLTPDQKRLIEKFGIGSVEAAMVAGDPELHKLTSEINKRLEEASSRMRLDVTARESVSGEQNMRFDDMRRTRSRTLGESISALVHLGPTGGKVSAENIAQVAGELGQDASPEFRRDVAMMSKARAELEELARAHKYSSGLALVEAVQQGKVRDKDLVASTTDLTRRSGAFSRIGDTAHGGEGVSLGVIRNVLSDVKDATKRDGEITRVVGDVYIHGDGTGRIELRSSPKNSTPTGSPKSQPGQLGWQGI